MLQLIDYKKAFGPAPILTIPQLDIGPGIYWLKGENGAGKTTFLKSVAGLIPFNGTIITDNINIRKQRMAYTKNVSFAEAEPVFPGFLTGQELIRFFSETKGENKPVVDRFSNEMNMHAYLKTKVGAYSSGMAKKLSLLLAFIGQPKLILLDEPFVTLDSMAVKFMHTIIEECAAKGTSFIISSHQALNFQNLYHVLKVEHQTINSIGHVTTTE